MELYDLNPARNKCPIPAEAPPLRESGADASTASSSSMVYVVGLLGPAFPAFGPQVGCPDIDIGPTWHTCPTSIFSHLEFNSPRWFLRSYQSLTFLYEPLWEMFEMLAVGPFFVVNQVSSYRTDKGKEGKRKPP